MEEFIANVVVNLAINHPTVAMLILVGYSARLVLKPAFSWLRSPQGDQIVSKVVAGTPFVFDNKAWSWLKENVFPTKYWEYAMYVLDWFFSIKKRVETKKQAKKS